MEEGEKPISRMCVQPKIYHSIHIFVPNILGVDILSWTVVGLLSVALSGPEWGEGTTSRMCVQSNIFDSILIFLPKIWGL